MHVCCTIGLIIDTKYNVTPINMRCVDYVAETTHRFVYEMHPSTPMLLLTTCSFQDAFVADVGRHGDGTRHGPMRFVCNSRMILL